MATKLDRLIAEVAISVATQNATDMMAEAAKIAAVATSAEAAKLPQRWAPVVSSKAAGAPELRDDWQSYWYEAIAEVLCQMKAGGVQPLIELWEQDSVSKAVVLIRLLRLAHEGIERESILRSVEVNFPSARNPVVIQTFRLINRWGGTELVDLLRPLSHVQTGSLGDTLGTYISEFDEARRKKDKRTLEQRPRDKTAKLVVSVVSLIHDRIKYCEQAQRAAIELGAGQVPSIAQLLFDTSHTDAATLLGRSAADSLDALRLWRTAILEILSYMGMEAIPVAWKLLEEKETSEKCAAVRLAVKLAALGTTEQCELTISQLASRMDKLRGVGMRSTICKMVDEVSSVPRMAVVLEKLGQVVVDDEDYSPQRVTIDSLVSQYRCSAEKAKPILPAQSQLFADVFAQAILARDFDTAYAMLLPSQQAEQTLMKFAAEFEMACEHSGWPTSCSDAQCSDLSAADLLDKHDSDRPNVITAGGFENWMEVEYLSDEEADTDADFAFYLNFALVNFGGELKIGAYRLNNRD